VAIIINDFEVLPAAEPSARKEERSGAAEGSASPEMLRSKMEEQARLCAERMERVQAH
jgi:hypothetical protein